MLPRIGIPWYRATIKQSVFEDDNQPRPFNFRLVGSVPTPNILVKEKFKSMAYEPSMALEPSMAYEPSMVTVPSLVPSPVPSPVPSLVPSPVPSLVPSPVPSLVPSPVPLPKPINIPVPKPVLPPPLREKETYKQPNLQPAYYDAKVREMEREVQREIMSEQSYKEMIQVDMLLERNLAQQRILNKGAKINTNSLTRYEQYLQQRESYNSYTQREISKTIASKQIKVFNTSMDNLGIKLGTSRDIMLDYITKNEITFGTLPYHYKEINKEIAKAGITGLAVGAIAYMLFQLAKVAVLAL